MIRVWVRFLPIKRLEMTTSALEMTELGLDVATIRLGMIVKI